MLQVRPQWVWQERGIAYGAATTVNSSSADPENGDARSPNSRTLAAKRNNR